MQRFVIGHQMPPSCAAVEMSGRQKKQTGTMTSIWSAAPGPAHWVAGGWEDPYSPEGQESERPGKADMDLNMLTYRKGEREKNPTLGTQSWTGSSQGNSIPRNNPAQTDPHRPGSDFWWLYTTRWLTLPSDWGHCTIHLFINPACSKTLPFLYKHICSLTESPSERSTQRAALTLKALGWYL